MLLGDTYSCILSVTQADDPLTCFCSLTCQVLSSALSDVSSG